VSGHRPRPRETLDRCALRAALRGDPMLGTAFPAARLLLVEQPGPWGPAGLRTSRLDPRVVQRLEERAAAVGIRVLGIRRPGRTPAGAVRRWALVDTRAGRETQRWGSYRADGDLLALDLTAEPADRPPNAGGDQQPVYLVCTNGKHDTCCAVRGRLVAAALDAARPGRAWECTHVGGDRFAANVLVLPAGLLYGRVLPFAATEFAAAADADEVVGALLRGRIGLPPAAQAALAFGYEHLALRSRMALQVQAVSPVVDGVVIVRLRGPHGLLDVTVRVEVVAADGLTCAHPGPNRYLAYRPVVVTEV
jgi:hypothetical protein